ncbi:MAG: hydantoinase B/oxoprolinase family protein [Verrucomicrobiota bacterium]|nr:hydantoinase B/oxoprolinase family protein [Verrucomicrobiota bacterium]
MSTHEINPIQLALFQARANAVAEEMGSVLQTSAYSPNIRERRDFSCALFDRNGSLFAQAAHIPVHLGSMSTAVRACLEAVPIQPGISFLLNDPYQGGTHLPDLTLVTPVFAGPDTEHAFLVASRAHHGDVGGDNPGSFAIVDHIDREGLRIPPTLAARQSELDPALVQRLMNVSRSPNERLGDLRAQLAANLLGAQRIKEWVESEGLEPVEAFGLHARRYAQRFLHDWLKHLPYAEAEATQAMEGDGFDDRAHLIRLRLSHHPAGGLVFDFQATNDQARGPINCVRAVTLSAVAFVLRCLLPADTPASDAILDPPCHVLTRQGSLLDAVFPAPVAAGNVETSQRVVDTILEALRSLLPPDTLPALPQGTMNNVLIGRDTAPGSPGFAYYETLGGGTGASANHHGASAVHSSMTNTLNTPIETLEREYPLRILRYGLRTDSGGKGRMQGGDGLVRVYQALAPCRVTLFAERRAHGPDGANGGLPGAAGRHLLQRAGERGTLELKGKTTVDLDVGDILQIHTPGGGGFGPPPIG